MRAEEVEHRKLDFGRADPRAQVGRRETRQVEEALRPPLVRQNPGERAQRQGRWVDR
jgi:hypothetical protein